MEIKLTLGINIRKLPIINVLKDTILNPDEIIQDILKKTLPFDATIFLKEEDYPKSENLLNVLEKNGVEVIEAKVKATPIYENFLKEQIEDHIKNKNIYCLVKTKTKSSSAGYRIEGINGEFILYEDLRYHDRIVKELLKTDILIK